MKYKTLRILAISLLSLIEYAQAHEMVVTNDNVGEAAVNNSLLKTFDAQGDQRGYFFIPERGKEKTISIPEGHYSKIELLYSGSLTSACNKDTYEKGGFKVTAQSKPLSIKLQTISKEPFKIDCTFVNESEFEYGHPGKMFVTNYDLLERTVNGCTLNIFDAHGKQLGSFGIPHEHGKGKTIPIPEGSYSKIELIYPGGRPSVCNKKGGFKVTAQSKPLSIDIRKILPAQDPPKVDCIFTNEAEFEKGQ